MLLGTYGRLRQADKAWAIYCHLLTLRPGDQQAAAAAAAAAAEGAAGAGRQAEADAKQADSQQQEQQRQGQPAPAAGWEDRLEQRQRELAAEAARLVADLRLGEVPFEQYAFGALITALSRVRCLPAAGAALLCCLCFYQFRECS